MTGPGFNPDAFRAEQRRGERTDPAPAFLAGEEIRAAVHRLTGGTGDPRSQYHDPLAALRVLMSLRAAVTQAERDAARRAREEGRSWGDIGEALGFADDPGPGMTLKESATCEEKLPKVLRLPVIVVWTG